MGKQVAVSVLSDRFRVHALRNPEATAIRDGSGTLTYGQAQHQVEILAQALRAVRREGDALLALSLAHTRNIAITVVAAFANGLGVLPLDRTHPELRTRFVLEDSGTTLVVTDAPDGLPGSAVVHDAGILKICRIQATQRRTFPLGVAYAFYTSGTTGQPKGCIIGIDQLTAFLRAASRVFGVTARDVSVFQSLTFDVGMWEMWSALSCGGSIVIPTDDQVRDPAAQLELYAESSASLIMNTPSWFAQILRAVDPSVRLSALRCALLVGEPIRPADVSQWIGCGVAPNATVTNVYGPTETTAFSTYCHLTEELCARIGSGPTPIGTPLPGTCVSLRDELGDPIGESPGEIWLGGSGVAHGYIGRDALESERFVLDDRDGGVQRYYRTGDWAIRRDDGLYFIGRRDDQVKLHGGVRVELTEVESVLRLVPGIQDAACTTAENRLGHRMLIAFVVRADRARVDERSIRMFASERLPREMCPQRIHFIDALPLNSNLKLDRGRLAEAMDAVAKL